MPKPYEFTSAQSLIEHLASEKLANAARRYFGTSIPDLRNIIFSAVASNTFRAFRNLPVRPSVLFRSWAEDQVRSTLPELQRFDSEQELDEHIHNATKSLCEVWRHETNSEMGYGRGAKLYNLVLKCLACYSEFSIEQQTKFISALHVPLDSYTLIGIRSIAPELKIPRSATMKFVTNRDQYRAIQNVIRAIASEAGVPPIYYDILAWDMGH